MKSSKQTKANKPVVKHTKHGRGSFSECSEEFFLEMLYFKNSFTFQSFIWSLTPNVGQNFVWTSLRT